ncbi:hypothetical protein C3481_05585 [Microbacterium sp. Ru50]|uniref:hypothetical protein n=1 Tax=Microbacterium sp. Ru50 TaxID=2080744 RepID=UPI000CDD8022|nr:hypothetical protein [Microbacterium sp. Ru50]POX67672.1 hypothetical protein C3481_05585 [Microbacterium sp. Ru50]
MADYEIVAWEKGTGLLRRMTLEQLKAELDALESGSAMRSAPSEDVRLSDLPDEMPGKEGLIAQYGPDYIVQTLPSDFPAPDPNNPDAPIEHQGLKYALVNENGHPMS